MTHAETSNRSDVERKPMRFERGMAEQLGQFAVDAQMHGLSPLLRRQAALRLLDLAGNSLMARTETVYMAERWGRVPYLPGLRAPYYLYVGRKRVTHTEGTE